MTELQDQKTYTIRELSEDFDVTTRTIRFYEDKGLLSPARQGQQRIYSNRDRVRLKLIMRGKRLGFSLNDIQEFLDLYDMDTTEKTQLRVLISRIDLRIETLLAQQVDIQASLDDLSSVKVQCKNLLKQKESNK